MATESWALDGVSLTSGAFSLMEVTADPPRERQDWISAADSEAAALFRQPKHENRTITMKLRVAPQASMNAALDQVGALVDKLRKASSTPAGVPLVWTAANASRAGTFTALAGEITGMPIALGGDGYSWLLSRPIVTVEMTCHPYGVGTETLTGTASSSTPFVTLEIASVTGDAPALARLIITDTATQSRRHVEWGLEGPLTYDAATSLIIDSDSLVTSGFSGAQEVLSGSYDPNSSGNNSIFSLSYPSPIALCGTGNQSHVGAFRVKGRFAFSGSDVAVRFTWKAGDGPVNANSWVPNVLGAVGFQELDLGTITIPAAVVGSQRWTGQVEAYSPGGAGPGVHLDYLMLIPVSDGYGKARASFTYRAGVLTGQDSFVGTTATSALGTRTAPLGGSWATSGDTTDFVFDDNFLSSPADSIESLRRSTGVSETNGRFAILGSTSYTDVQVEIKVINFASDLETSVIARWTDSSNYLRLRVPTTSSGSETAYLEQVVAGVVTVIAQTAWVRSVRPYLYRLTAFASGRAVATISDTTGSVLAAVDGSSSTIATGGTLATGKPGIRDRSTGISAVQRNYTSFVVSTPPAEPIVLYSGRNMQVRYDDVLRQDSAGTYSGRPQSYRGSRFNLSPGTSRIMVKAKRNDIETAADANVTDALQIQVGWTPRFLAVPR